MFQYKFSRYNIEVAHEGQHLLFNGNSGALLTLNPHLKSLMDFYRENPDGLSAEEPEFFQGLLQTQCLVKQDLDEMDRIRARSKRAVYQDRTYELTINPTMNCNFKCWYCYEGHVKSKMTIETQDLVVAHVTRLAEAGEISALQLGWFGGEPMMTFTSVVYPLSKRLQEVCAQYNLEFSNSVTTNAYLLHSSFAEMYREIKLFHFQITLDGSRERHNKVRFLKGNQQGTFDRIIENINMLIEKVPEVFVNLRINFEDETLRKIDEILPEFPVANRARMNVDFQRVWQTCNEEVGESGQLKHTIDRFNAAGYNSFAAANEFVLFRGKKCYADKWYQAVINYDGGVFKCTARDFIPENREGLLGPDGDILWNQAKIDRRFKRSPWERERCESCSLLPLCMGPCSQAMIETGEENRNNGCFLDNLELTVEDYVIERYREHELRSQTMMV